MSKATTVKVAPKALVVHQGKKGERGTLVIIQLGTIKVAGGILGGTYNEQQALVEFKKGHKNLKVAEGMSEVAEGVRKMIP